VFCSQSQQQAEQRIEHEQRLRWSKEVGTERVMLVRNFGHEPAVSFHHNIGYDEDSKADVHSLTVRVGTSLSCCLFARFF
jgi:hypothetical protein